VVGGGGSTGVMGTMDVWRRGPVRLGETVRGRKKCGGARVRGEGAEVDGQR
jgi:hypothetical protein